ncbi:hypothetical protein ACPXCS_37275 [Streptomyces sp. DT190]|uniref:hypothetical protein n=1 Tax=unclassified Streptomyces TaxID=2593676 RepID=UPI003CF3F913
MQNSKAADARRLNPAGVLLSVAAVAAVLWAVIEGPDRGWTSSTVLTAFAAGAVLAGAFTAWQRRGASPMLPLRIFRHRALASGDVLILLGAFALIGTLFVVVHRAARPGEPVRSAPLPPPASISYSWLLLVGWERRERD